MRRSFGSIKELGRNRYQVFWSENGTRHSHRINGSKRDAERYLAKVEAGLVGYGDSTTYSEYWDSTVSVQISHLAEKTQAEYTRLWNSYIKPRAGARKIASTTYSVVQQAIDEVNGSAQKRAVATLWRKICNMAVRDGIIDRNPVQGIVFPPRSPRPKTILPAEDVLSYIEDARTSKYAHIVMLELCAGLRHEEACAIESGDIEFVDGIAYINIERARVSVAGKVVEKDTKNSFSARRIPVCGIIASWLNASMVKSVNPQTVTHNWREWCKRHGKKYIPFGQMRTNFVTHACECAPASLVDLYVGHSDGSVRMKHYQKATEYGLMMVAQAHAEYIGGENRTDLTPQNKVSAGQELV